MSRILYLDPVAFDGEVLEHDVESVVRPENSVTVVSLARGPRHVEYRYYETLVLRDVVHSVIRAEELGFDAVVIGCFYDLGLQESREVAERMVITAPCEAACLLAASLGSSFSVIVGRRKWIPQMRSTIGDYGLASRLASFRTLDFGVLDYHRDEEETAQRFVEAGRRAVAEDGAEAIVLGCTASSGFYARLQDALHVPVIDSAIAAVKQAEQLIDLRDRFGWSHSKIGGYESPPASEISQWRLREDFGADEAAQMWIASGRLPLAAQDA